MTNHVMRKKSSMIDVAMAADVSRSAVSRVINNDLRASAAAVDVRLWRTGHPTEPKRVVLVAPEVLEGLGAL